MKILTAPEPLLRQPSQEISPEYLQSEECQKLIESILVKAKEISAVGLAGPQVGIPYSVFAYYTGRDREYEVIINPRILAANFKVTNHNEACFSLPGATFRTKRYKEVVVTGQDRAGKTITRKSKNKLQAFCFQHEIDHLSGILLDDIGQEN